MMKKTTVFIVCLLSMASWTLQAQAANAPIVMNKYFMLHFSEMPKAVSYQVDISQLDLTDKAGIKARFKAAETLLTSFEELDMEHKVVTLKINQAFELPSQWNLDNWNEYFEQVGTVMAELAD